MTTEALKRKPTYYRSLILASCDLVAMAHRMIEWRGGHYAKITGTIHSTLFGDIRLDNDCMIAE